MWLIGFIISVACNSLWPKEFLIIENWGCICICKGCLFGGACNDLWLKSGQYDWSLLCSRRFEVYMLCDWSWILCCLKSIIYLNTSQLCFFKASPPQWSLIVHADTTPAAEMYSIWLQLVLSSRQKHPLCQFVSFSKIPFERSAWKLDFLLGLVMTYLEDEDISVNSIVPKEAIGEYGMVKCF